MNRADVVRGASRYREQLTADAVAEFDEQGTAPTWRLPDVATVTLPISRQTVVVADEGALLKWTVARHPSEVETVHRMRAAFVNALLGMVTVTDDGQVVDPAGEIVPGLAVREGGRPKPLTIRPADHVRELIADRAQQMIALLDSAVNPPGGEL